MAELTPGPNPPEEISVLVHISSHSLYYYVQNDVLTLNKKVGKKLPVAYGVIPATHHTDAEQLDAFVLVSEPPIPGSLIPARPVGLMRLEGGKIDDKIIAVCSLDSEFDKIRDIKDVPKNIISELEGALKKKLVTKITWLDAAKAKKAVEFSIELYKKEME